MTTNIKVAQNVSTDGAIITGFRYVDSGLTLGSTPTPSHTRVMAMHVYSTIVGDIIIKGTKQITNKTAAGTAIRYRVAALDSQDTYIGDMGVGVFGIVSLATSGAAAMLPTITLYVG
jgi:hypothetical protein